MNKHYILFIWFSLLLVTFSCKKDMHDGGIVITSFNPTEGTPGNAINIKGKGFGNSINVVKLLFNGTEATVTAITDTLISTTVPVNATTGKITVSVNGKNGESITDFIILPGVWIRKKDVPYSDVLAPNSGSPGRVYASGFAIGNKGYVGGGTSPNKDGVGPYLTDWLEYDPSTDQWTSKAGFPFTAGLIVGVSFTINDKGYVGIGHSKNNFTNEFWQYDPATDHWTRKADFPGSWKKSAIGFGVGSKGYMGLGESWDSLGAYARSDWWENDPATDHWTRKTDFPGGSKSDAAGFVINDKIYLGCSHLTTDWWEYDAATDHWTGKADYPNKFNGGSSGFVIGNKGYIAGGIEGKCWEYDPSLDKWTQEYSFFDSSRGAGVAFAIGNKGYFTTGSGCVDHPWLPLLPCGPQNDLWEFTPTK